MYRDKKSDQYEHYAKLFLQLSKSHEKRLLHGDIFLAKQLGADGIHLRSDQLMQITKAKSYGLFTVVSTHSIDEAMLAQKLGADAVTISPIFESPHKGEPKGIKALQEFIDALNTHVIALGGIVGEEQLKQLESVKNLYGFASIRYFVHP